MYVEYESNNSGGSWWLGDSHWKALEAAGWKVLWASLEEKYTAKGYELDADGTPLLVPIGDSSLGGDSYSFNLKRKGADGEYRFLGALATHAFRAGLSLREAVAEWERVTGLDASASGCECCGPPHVFASTSIPK